MKHTDKIKPSPRGLTLFNDLLVKHDTEGKLELWRDKNIERDPSNEKYHREFYKALMEYYDLNKGMIDRLRLEEKERKL